MNPLYTQLQKRKDYLQKLHIEICRELASIENYLSSCTCNSLEKIYSDMTPPRRSLITPLAVPDEIRITKWLNEPFTPNPYYEEHRIYQTRNGEFVRSKSEVLIADMYFEMGIPYKYEAPLRLRYGKLKYPDFTLLNTGTNQLIYHEHLGCLDDSDYLQSNLNKIYDYLQNDIFIGNNLIITFESESCPLDIPQIKKLVRSLLY